MQPTARALVSLAKGVVASIEVSTTEKDSTFKKEGNLEKKNTEKRTKRTTAKAVERNIDETVKIMHANLFEPYSIRGNMAHLLERN